MTTEDPNPRPQNTPVRFGTFGSDPLVQPPLPTGPLAPPPPPPLPTPAPDLADSAESARQQAGAHRYVSTAPAADARLGAQLPVGLRLELEEALDRAGGRLSEVFDRYRAGMTTPAALAAAGATPSEAIAADLMLRIRTILGESWFGPPARARSVAGTVRALMRTPGLSNQAQQYLVGLRAKMLHVAESEAAQQQEQSMLDTNSAALERELRTDKGVFVYTYPHYWRYPYLVEQNRRLLRLGSTADAAWQRVIDQARAAGAPEDPVLLRVYATADPAAADLAFHRLLESADHGAVLNSSDGREWFATTLEFLDEIADVLGIEIKAGPDPAL